MYSLVNHEVHSVFKPQGKISEGWGFDYLDIPSFHELKLTGRGVKVAIIDTGVAIHESMPFTTDYDKNGHGTHVGGILTQVAPNANIWNIAALDKDGYGSNKMIALSIRDAINWGADIINMSFGSEDPSDRVRTMTYQAAQKGVLMFAAAGNNGLVDGGLWPSEFPWVHSVGALDQNGQPTDFTPVDESIEFWGPGEGILSSYLDNKYAILSGTSMATPFVSGLAALALSGGHDFRNFLNM